jgi:hypothetical protein
MASRGRDPHTSCEVSRVEAALLALETNDALEDMIFHVHAEVVDRSSLGYLGRFVDALECHKRIRSIVLDARESFSFEGVGADLEYSDAHRVFVRLFGIVLPNHPSLTRISVFLPAYRSGIELLLSSLPTNKCLEELACSASNDISAGVVAGILLRKVKIERLFLSVCGWGPDDCKMVCDAVVENRHLRGLAVDCIEPRAATFANVAGAGSPLTWLSIGARWTTECFLALIEYLKDNFLLKHLTLVFQCERSDSVGPNLDCIPWGSLTSLLEKDNGTLRTVTLESCGAREKQLDYYQKLINDILMRPRPYKRGAAAPTEGNQRGRR